MAPTEVPILYGGSCTPENANEFFVMADIDGALVGGASLDAAASPDRRDCRGASRVTDGRPRPVVLCVLDGFGIGDDPRRNALMAADLPAWDRIDRHWPTCQLVASGEAVGLPPGQMGNSEVGHLNLGAGFPVLQDLPRISKAIADGTSSTTRCCAPRSTGRWSAGSRLHLLGLIGPGGIHAVDEPHRGHARAGTASRPTA